MSLSANLSWKINIPLINNRFVISNVIQGIALTLLLFFVIIGSIFGWANGMEGVGQAFIACLWAGVFLVMISVLTLAVFLGNKYLLEFTINEEGVVMKSRSEQAHFAHRLALILGVLGRNLATVGAGAAGVAGETSRMPWNKIKSVKAYPDKKIIRLKRNFFETMFVYCTEENFKDVSALITEKSAENKGRPDRAGEEASGVSVAGPSHGKNIPASPVNAACPKCNARDFSQKADDAVSRLQSIPGKENPDDKELEEAVRREEIMKYLAKPKAPAPFSLSRWALVMLIPVINVIAVFFSPLIKGLKIFISAIAVIFIISVVRAVGFAGDSDNAQMAAGLLGSLMCVLYWIGLVYSWNVAKADCRGKLAEYERILPRWEHLFYCDQCKVVFFDDRPGRSAPVEEVKSFLAT